MKSTNPLKSDLANLNTTRRKNRTRSLRLSLRFGAILILAGLLASGFYWSSAASSFNRAMSNQKSTVANEAITNAPALAALGGASSLGRFASLFAAPAPQAAPSIAIYASDCSTPQTLFNLQDADKTVCAVVTGGAPTSRIIWSNARFIAVQNQPVGAGTSTFMLTAGSSLGDWRVILFEPFGGAVQAVSSFTVIDAENPSADVSVSKGLISGNLSSGGQAVFSIQVGNAGPSSATTVELSDAVPANTTFVSFDQLTGPVFSCTSPTAGSSSGSTVCTIPSLARGEEATFVATYQVDGVASGTVIANTAAVTSGTADPNSDNNISSSEGTVVGSACQISAPDNITVDADSGQAGAVVTYATPTYSGDCGTAVVGEGGQTIPVISCNPVSGSFFAAGSTTVICVAQVGSAVTFQVTVNNPGALSISLSGANPLTVECGAAFTDPGATAVNGTGQSVDVVVTGPTIDRDTDPGTYTVTYTATEDPNSVSVERTIIVEDTESPTITIDGANPYRIQTGSCSPFVDPGVSANDGCAGAKPVTTSISGPGGVTAVDNNVPGTYTITYTATDGTHEATATRTVLVGNFSEDEVDQPASSNVPPTITLNGAEEIHIECGSPFTDPGATASVCGGSVAVTTTGTVDIHTPGIYSITYSATANGFTTETTRTVTVEPDNSAPTITLNGANPMTVECHTSFTDPGAVAHDACAGDFPATASGSVDANTVGSYTITYNATDPSGHAATPVVRTVNVVDTTNPTISCQANIVVDFNPAVNGAVVTYTTPVGADSCSSTTTTQTAGLASGSTFPAGTTTNTFTATDGSGHTATCSFTVTVAAPALIGLDSVSISGAGYTDSYNGAYPATKSSLVNVLSNGAITMTNSGKVWGNVRSTRAGVNMSGASQVTGNATAGTTVSRSGSATVGGTITNNALAPVMTLPSVSACGPYSSNAGISGTYSYNSTTGNLTLSGVNIATLANGAYCFNNITLTNSAQLKVNGLVTIKLTGTLNTGGATSFTNTTGNPGNLRILSSYSGTTGVTLGNSTSVYAVIYAPSSGVNISGAAPLFGTAVGKTITIGNSGAVHYKTTLNSVWADLWALLP
jgi:uncharacterized repeat protein (TIGR01451 family)